MCVRLQASSPLANHASQSWMSWCCVCLCRTFSLSSHWREASLCSYSRFRPFGSPRSRRMMITRSFGHIVTALARTHARAPGKGAGPGLGWALGCGSSFIRFSFLSSSSVQWAGGTKYLSKQSVYSPVPEGSNCASGTHPSFIFPWFFRSFPSRILFVPAGLDAVATGYLLLSDP